MAKRRYQNPTPFREGSWWWILIRQDEFKDGHHTRRVKRVKLAPATTKEREAQKIAAEYLRPLNQGLESIGSATNFTMYVNDTYKPVVLPLMAKSTQSRAKGILDNYLIPAFGSLSLRDITTLKVQTYVTGLLSTGLQYESMDKIRDTLASVLGSAVKYQLLVKNPVEDVSVPRKNKGGRTVKPTITFEQFDRLIDLIPEPYATMVYTAVYSGLRVSELIGLRWNDVGENTLMVDERYCRGDWSAPKSTASNAAVSVPAEVIERIHQLKDKTVTVNSGGHGAKKTYACVKSANPDDLVFQSLRKGSPMRDNNILTRHIKPAARKLGLDFVNWRCLRTSCATWLKKAGADPKDIQGQLRHSRISTSMEIYVQDVPESRRAAVANLPVRRIM